MARPAPESASILAGVGSALGASACCLLPLALVAAGVGGAWVAQLRELERFYYLFVAAAAAAFAFAFYRLYLRPASDCATEACADPVVRRRQRVTFWVSLIAAKALALSPFYVPALLA